MVFAANEIPGTADHSDGLQVCGLAAALPVVLALDADLVEKRQLLCDQPPGLF